MSHTPGPWYYGFESVDPEWAIVTIKGGLIVANVNAHSRQEANARLIAAAPDLLEACEAAESCFYRGGANTPRMEWHTAYLKLLRAIAKAKGQQP